MSLFFVLRLICYCHLFLLQEMNKESMANLHDDIAKLRVQVPNTIHPSNLI